ncbi:helix-turn-helix domain-containing protein [Amycolatopsis minnesotensis]|uniref:HTH tetR-type domain-containing protein n=1 Tax=Amycolatopsis minnesotensis TaxID=337894 RepID=A0ABN2S277_9PSEU
MGTEARAAARGERKRRTYAARIPASQRRTELLDAALHLVVTKGHSAVTMNAVAEEAGVTKPVVYGVFVNRADLLGALLRREQEQALQQILTVLPERFEEHLGDDDPGAVVADVLAKFLRAVRAKPERWHCVVMPMADMPPEFHAAREHARAQVLASAEELAAAFLTAVGSPAGLDADIVGNTVVTLFEMAARLVLDDPARFRPERFVTAIQAAIGLMHPRENQ